MKFLCVMVFVAKAMIPKRKLYPFLLSTLSSSSSSSISSLSSWLDDMQEEIQPQHLGKKNTYDKVTALDAVEEAFEQLVGQTQLDMESESV